MHRPISIAFLLLSLAVPARGEIFVELADSGLDFVHFNGMSGEYYMPEINCAGGAVADFDGDGDLDLYLVQGAMLAGESAEKARVAPRHPLPLTDRLYRNDLEIGPDGQRVLKFTDVTEDAGLEATTGYGFGVATGDYDNDGDVDLYVTQLGSNVLLRNVGAGEKGAIRFEEVPAAAGADDRRWSVPAAFADHDRDGWLDLYVGNYVDWSEKSHKICRTSTGAQDYCGPTAYPGVSDRLFRNRGDGRFEDVTARAGIGRVRSKSLGVVAADFNADGRLDFYVANDMEANQMWLQEAGGSFVDEALLAGNAVNAHGDAEASMGVDAGDFDGDGDDDLFMTHLGGETNTLFLNDGTGLFEDATIDTGLGPPSWNYTGWGSAFFDWDNDGRLEMMIANGAVRVIEELASRGDPFPFHEPNQLFHNLGPVEGGSGKKKSVRFEEVTERAGPVFELSETSRAIAIGDLDNDGDSDVLLTNNNGPARVLVNTVGQDAHWLGLRLVGTEGERDMLGARAELLRSGEKSLWRRVRTDGSFAAGNDPRVLFGLGKIGLGKEEGEAEVRVHWPSGRVETWAGLEIDRYHTLREGSGKASS